MQQAKKHFITAEKAVLECEQNMINLTQLEGNACFIQSAGKNHWLILFLTVINRTDYQNIIDCRFFFSR
jgi:hypothetical protein